MGERVLEGRLRCASAAFVLNMLLGLIYAWSLFVEPLEAQFGWVRADTAQVFTVSMVFFCLGHLASGALTPRKGSRFVILLAAVCASAGFILSAWAVNLLWLMVSYGVLCGFSVGLGANCVLSTVLLWFPRERGTASGVLLAGVGLGPLLFGPAIALLIERAGWQLTFILLGLVFGLALGAGACVVRPPRARECHDRNGMGAGRKSASYDASALDGSREGAQLAPGDMVRTAAFWVFFAWMVVVSSVGLALISNAVPAALEVLTAAGASSGALLAATGAMGAISGFNAVGRLATGRLWDRWGATPAMGAVSLLLALSMVLCLMACALVSFGLIVAGFLMLGFAYGGSVSVASAFTGKRFGMRHYAMNYALVTLNIMVASLLGPAISGWSFTLEASYLPAYQILLGFAVVSLVLVGVLRRLPSDA
ncbi:MAG: MFS transporter [Adlercreutzia sp.]|nr:MFS transporter [Adlercreutzia sp.]